MSARPACRTGPCLIPVAPGLMAPSGVTMIGLALVLRDLVQRRLGVVFRSPRSSLGAGSALARAAVAGDRFGRGVPALRTRRSCGLYAAGAPPASCPRWWRRASSGLWSIPSCSCGSPSVARFLAGQVVGKAWMVLLSIPFVVWLRRRDERLGCPRPEDLCSSRSPRSWASSRFLPTCYSGRGRRRRPDVHPLARAGWKLVVRRRLIGIAGLSPFGNALVMGLEERSPPWDASRGAPDGIVVLGGAVGPAMSDARSDLHSTNPPNV